MSPQQIAPELSTTRCNSGCPGLDDVLGGGLPVGHVHLVEGEPGTGKTTMALQFAAEGLRRGEKVLYVILSESEEELLLTARNHQLRMDGIEILELKPSEQDLKPEGQYTDSLVTLIVEDQGKGIPRDVLERFSKSGTNVGVGLAGMRERVKELGGSFKLSSDNNGTRLTVILPVSESTADSTASSDSYPLTPSKFPAAAD